MEVCPYCGGDESQCNHRPETDYCDEAERMGKITVDDIKGLDPLKGEATFSSYIPKGPYDHFANGPINWAGITKISKLDVTYAGSDSVDDRDQYYIYVEKVEGRYPFQIPFGFDYELRDKVFDVIRDHQENHLRSY